MWDKIAFENEVKKIKICHLVGGGRQTVLPCGPECAGSTEWWPCGDPRFVLGTKGQATDSLAGRDDSICWDKEESSMELVSVSQFLVTRDGQTQ